MTEGVTVHLNKLSCPQLLSSCASVSTCPLPSPFFEAPSWVLSSLWHLSMPLQWCVGLVPCTAHSYSTLGKPTLMQNPNNYLWFRQFMCSEAYKHFILIYSHYICILIIDTNPVVYIQWLKKPSQCLAVSERWADIKSGKFCKIMKIIYVIE